MSGISTPFPPALPTFEQERVTPESATVHFVIGILGQWLFYDFCQDPLHIGTTGYYIAMCISLVCVYTVINRAILSLFLKSVRDDYTRSHREEWHLPLWQDILGYGTMAFLSFLTPSDIAFPIWFFIVLAAMQDASLRFYTPPVVVVPEPHRLDLMPYPLEEYQKAKPKRPSDYTWKG